MTNTDLMFTYVKEYQDKRFIISETYNKAVEAVESAKGSKYYDEHMEQALKEKNASMAKLRGDYATKFDNLLASMQEANNRRTMTAPTQEQLNILQLLDSRENVSKDELDRVYNTMSDCDLAISKLNEIAKKNEHLHRYSLSGVMGITEADAELQNLADEIRDFMDYETTRGSRLADKFHQSRYGGSVSVQRRRYTNKSDFFGDSERDKAFMSAVD